LNDKIRKTGTTTIGIVAKDAVILAADMKATMGHIAASEDATKIYTINDHLAITIAGSYGDGLILIRHLKNHANLYELEHKRLLSTKSCVTLLSNILNSTKMVPFYTQYILAGVDLKLYNIDIIGGASEESKFTCTGSGTELALSTLDREYKSNLSVKDAINLAKETITAAKKRDIYSGGDGIKVVVISKKGVEELPIIKYDK